MKIIQIDKKDMMALYRFSTLTEHVPSGWAQFFMPFLTPEKFTELSLCGHPLPDMARKL